MKTPNSYLAQPRVIAIAMALAVLLPTLSIFWYMFSAVNNEQLAAQGKVRSLYKGQLLTISEQFEMSWQNTLKNLQQIDTNGHSQPQLFSHIVDSGLATAVVFIKQDQAPHIPLEAMPAAFKQKMQQGKRLEFRDKDYSLAIQRYTEAASLSPNPADKAAAYQAMVRNHVKQQAFEQASTVLQNNLLSSEFDDLASRDGRSIHLIALLRLLDLVKHYPLGDELQKETQQRLIATLNDYQDPSITSQQRLFVIEKFPQFASALHHIDATRLAVQFQQQHISDTTAKTSANSLQLRPFSLALTPEGSEDYWSVWLPEKSLFALYDARFFEAKLAELSKPVEGVALVLHPLNSDSALPNELVSKNLDHMVAGWRLSYHVDSKDAVADLIKAKTSAYIWVGLLLIGLISLIFLLIYIIVSRQQRLSQLKNNIVDTVTHELKTPLSAIRMFVEILLHSNTSLDSTARDYLNLIDKENKRLSSLIENFLTFSRLDSLEQPLNPHIFLIEDWLAQTLASFDERFNKSHVEFICSIDPALHQACGDTQLLSLLLSNLLDNAYKYSGDTKRIELQLHKTAAKLTISVIDNGRGMSKREQHKVFDRFYRANDQLNSGIDGCGLGLNICKQIVALHKGELSLKSQAGSGCTFTATLPILENNNG